MKHLIATLFLLLGACAGTKLRRSPAEGGNDWFEIRSAHFTLQTDLPLEEARARSGAPIPPVIDGIIVKRRGLRRRGEPNHSQGAVVSTSANPDNAFQVSLRSNSEGEGGFKTIVRSKQLDLRLWLKVVRPSAIQFQQSCPITRTLFLGPSRSFTSRETPK